MNKIIIGTHGDFGKELLKTAEMIIGPLENVQAFSLLPGMEMTEYRELILSSLDSENNYIALVDLFGGTPSNTIASFLMDYNFEIISGVNLPMLLEVYSNLNGEETCELKVRALDALQMSGFDVKEKVLNRMKQRG